MNRCPQLIVLVLLALVPHLARAGGVQSQMDSMFRSMSSTNDPAVHMGARRGVISGGSYSERTRVADVRPFSVTLPSFGGGCGGIDAYMGSFSMINTDQYVAMMRAVASNAKGYAFKIAIDAVSSMIGEELDNLSKTVQDWTKYNMNSCQMVQAAMAPMDAAAQSYATNWRASRGTTATDTSEASEQGTGRSATAGMYEDAPDAVRAQVTVNYVWKSLKDANATSWFASGDQALLEELMSLTGTVISCMPGTDGCRIQVDASDQPAVEGETRTITVPASLKLLDLVEGSRGLSVDGGATTVVVLTCQGSEHCLNPGSAERSIEGFENRVRTVLLGASNRAGEGLIGRFARFDGEPTAQEKALLTSLGDFGTRILNLTRLNEAAARSYCTEYLRPITVEFVYHMVRDMIEAVAAAVGDSQYLGNEQVVDLIFRARQQLDTDRMLVADKVQVLEAMTTTYVNLMASMRPDWRDMSSAQSLPR